GDFWVLRTKELNSKYIFYLLQTSKFKNVSNISTGTKMPRADWTTVSNKTFIVPTNLNESERIGILLSTLDAYINLHQKKTNILIRLKKEYLKNLLPQNKERTPLLRFNTFNENWVNSSLGDLLVYEQPTKYIVENTEYNNHYSTPVLTEGKSFILVYTDKKDGIEIASPDNPVIIFDDFTTSSHYVDFPFKVKSSAMKLLDFKDRCSNKYFIFNSLKNIKYSPQNHERHWISIFSNWKVPSPSYKEQQRLGSIFKRIDELIVLHQKKVDTLNKIKNVYLDKIFL